MSNDDNFDLAPNMEEPINEFRIVHIYNKSNIYHLTRQVLLDSALTQDTYCFFYHILAKNIYEFNDIYGSFACLFSRTIYEADLYLNAESDALEHIIKYVQTGKIDGEKIYLHSWKLIDEIIDLASMFGMPNLVSLLRALHPSEEKIDSMINGIKIVGINIINYYQYMVDHEELWFNKTDYIEKFNNFIEENRESIIDLYIKNNIYYNPFYHKLINLYTTVFVMPLLNKLISKSDR